MKLNTQWLGKNCSFSEIFKIQCQIHQKIFEKKNENTLLNLEHSPVYTDKKKAIPPASLPYPFINTNRGGKITYHGNGQLVSYPLLNLKEMGSDLHLYLRLLEKTMILLLQEYGIKASLREGLTGVWVKNRKIGFIGVGVRKWITLHGCSLNLSMESLPPFKHIIPCGITDAKITCLEKEIKKNPPSSEEAGENFAKILQKKLKEY